MIILSQLCLVILLTTANAYKDGSDIWESKVEESYKASQVVPDVVPKAPKNLLYVNYPTAVVELGNELTPTQVKNAPFVTWKANPDDYYTLAMVDPDVPARVAPFNREFIHWLVVNIHGKPGDQHDGETLAEYLSPAPPLFTGLHRYVFLVFKQPSLLSFLGPRLNNTTMFGRARFSTTKFAERYNLGDPTAGNFFQAQFDELVPILQAQQGI